MIHKAYLIAGISIMILLSGCSSSLDHNPPTIIQDDIIDTSVPQTSGWNILGSQYTIQPVSGSKTTTYSGDLFTTVKITEKSTQRRTYFTSYPGQWSDFEIARESNMFSGEIANTITSNLSNQAFDTLTGINNNIRYHVQVPIDRTLLVHQTDSEVFVLDFDDPSDAWNKMKYKDIQELIQYVNFL